MKKLQTQLDKRTNSLNDLEKSLKDRIKKLGEDGKGFFAGLVEDTKDGLEHIGEQIGVVKRSSGKNKTSSKVE
ncbi:hypothetical protein WDW89_10345 [Deltaproteobacteria bacterium TL4]